MVCGSSVCKDKENFENGKRNDTFSSFSSFANLWYILALPFTQQRDSIKQALSAFQYDTINYLSQNGTISSLTINEYINADCK